MSRLGRLRRPLSVLALVVALWGGYEAWQGSAREVSVVYDAPPGDLQVTLLDAEDRPLRRVFFAAGAERRHEVRLPEGALTARLEVDGRRIERGFHVGDGDFVEIRVR